MWKVWCALEDSSGFDWDEPTQLFTAEDSLWKEYLKAPARAKVDLPRVRGVSRVYMNSGTRGVAVGGMRDLATG